MSDPGVANDTKSHPSDIELLPLKELVVNTPLEETTLLSDSAYETSMLNPLNNSEYMEGSIFTFGLFPFELTDKHAELDAVGGNDALKIPRSYNVDSKGNLWIGTVSGIHIKTATNNTQLIRPQDGLSYYLVTAITEDQDNNTWLGYGNGGFARIKNGSITNFKADGNAVLTMKNCAPHEIWIGKYNGLFIYNDSSKRYSQITTKQGLPGNMVQCIHKASNGIVWVGTDNGLARIIYHRDSIYVTPVTDSLQVATKSITGITEDAAGKIWFTTATSGAMCIGKAQYFYLNSKNGLPSDSLISITMGPYHSIVIGGHGCVMIGKAHNSTNTPNNTMQFERELKWYPHEFKGTCVTNTIIRDKENVIWIGSTAGTIRLVVDKP